MTIILSILVLSILILIHEIGHFTAARRFGVKVEEFGIGLPPRALKLFRKKGTEYTLNWLPMGGFVRLYGEERGGEKLDPKVAFYAKPLWQRAIVLSAGVIANLILGVVLFSMIYTYTGVPIFEGENVAVVEVADGSPAQIAGIEAGDVFMSIDGEDVTNVDEFIEKIQGREDESVSFRIGRIGPEGTLSDEIRQIEMIPRGNPPEGEGALGVSLAGVADVRYEKKPWYLAPFYGIVDGVKEAYFWAVEIIRGIVTLFAGIILSGRLPEGIAGPVGIFKLTGEVSQYGLVAVSRFVAILSINLGMFNLLPIPALDGGRLVFLLLEKIFGKKRVGKFEGVSHMVGYALLIGLLVVITWKDILVILGR